MKTSQILLTTVLATAGLFQAACSAEIKGGSPLPIFEKPQEGFTLSALNGSWKSPCNTFYGRASDEVLTVKEGSFSSVTKTYRDQNCVESELDSSRSSKGVIVAIKESTTEPGAMEVDIETQMSGYTQIQAELVKVIGNNLYFADLNAPANGDYPSKLDLANPYTKVVR